MGDGWRVWEEMGIWVRDLAVSWGRDDVGCDRFLVC